MDYIFIVILIILLCLLLIGLYLLVDCLGDPGFSFARRASGVIGVDVIGQNYSKFSYGDHDFESCYSQQEKMLHETKQASSSCCSPPLPPPYVNTMSHQSDKNGCNNAGAGTVALLVSALHRGGQSYHSQGLCNVGGGTWSSGARSPTVWASGRPPGANTWSPVSGGIFDNCQCEDSGGFF